MKTFSHVSLPTKFLGVFAAGTHIGSDMACFLCLPKDFIQACRMYYSLVAKKKKKLPAPCMCLFLPNTHSSKPRARASPCRRVKPQHFNPLRPHRFFLPITCPLLQNQISSKETLELHHDRCLSFFQMRIPGTRVLLTPCAKTAKHASECALVRTVLL
jgi:hypothetical protein